MLRFLIKKDIANNFEEPRIQILSSSIIILSLIITLNSIFEYKETISQYDTNIEINEGILKDNIVYATIKPTAIRYPIPLLILCKGVYYDFGNILTFDIGNIPIEAKNMTESNPYTNEFANFDLSKIFLWLLSIISILVSYDSITREREQGTLKLILINRVSKFNFIVSKIVSSLLTLSIILIIIFFIILIIFSFTPWIAIDFKIFNSLVLFFVVSFFYSAIWIFTGIIISLFVSNSDRALVISILVWVVLNIINPSIIKSLIEPSHLSDEKMALDKKIHELNADYTKEYNKIWESTLGPLIRDLQFNTMSGGPENEPIWFPNPATLDKFKVFYEKINLLKLNYADKKYQVSYDSYILPYQNKINKLNFLKYCSPASLFEYIYMKISNSSYDDYFIYYNSAVQYRNQVVNFFNNKKAFSSIKWFSPENIPYDSNHPMYSDNDNLTNENVIKMINYRKKVITENKIPMNDFPVFYPINKSFSFILAEIFPPIIFVLFSITLLVIVVLIVGNNKYLL
jgi:ABC-type transport system involved in multi-copper enzyme maturation permease subunit